MSLTGEATAGSSAAGRTILIIALIVVGAIAVAGTTATAVLVLTRPTGATPTAAVVASTSSPPVDSSAPSAAPATSSGATEVRDEPAEPATIVTLTGWQAVRTHQPAQQFETDQCLSSSVISRSNAYRCWAGNLIYDPCIGVDVGALVCPAAPWTGKYVGIYYTGYAGDISFTDRPRASGTPWGIQLASGQRCSFLSGVTEMIGSRRLNYDCGKAGAIYGDPHRGRVWTVKVALNKTDGRLTTVPLRHVWY